MGMLIIESNKTLNLSQYGLKVGDPITVICVGGGAGGNGGNYAGSYYYYQGNGGNAGEGGGGGRTGNSNWGYGGGGGGAGAGYGAGGGGGGGGVDDDSSYVKPGSPGGGAGNYNMASHILNATTVNSISVTIGAGGNGSRMVSANDSANKATNGGVTSFGSICSASGGTVGAGGSGGRSGTYSGGGGGGGAGGYLLPMKLYGGGGGTGGDGGMYNYNSNINITFIIPERPVMSLGGGGGAGGKSSRYTLTGEKAQTSIYGGVGGVYGGNGSKGVMSKGSGVVIVLW